MASIRALFFIFIIFGLAVNAEKAFVWLECKNTNVGQDGQQTLLECVVKTAQRVEDVVIRVVTWRKEGVDDPLLVFENGKTEPLLGYKFAHPTWNESNMNVSLLITNTALENAGDYMCMVMTDSGDAETSIRLEVTAKYKKPTIRSIPEKLTRHVDAVLICDSDGGYPEGQIRWFVDGNNDWTRSAEMDVKKTQSGRFHLTSSLTLLRGSTFSTYTCTVFNARGGKDAESILEINTKEANVDSGGEKPVSPSNIVAPLVVIGSLITGLLVALLVYRRRTRQDRRHSTAPLTGDL